MLLGVHWKDHNVVLCDVLNEVPILNVEVFGMRSELWCSSQLKSSMIILKYMAVNIGFA